jgi:hypothetical protein
MNDKLVTALAGVLVVLPGTAALVPDLHLTPEVSFVLLILSLVGAAILKQQNPLGATLSDEDVRRIATERERIRREEIAKVKAAGRG